MVAHQLDLILSGSAAEGVLNGLATEVSTLARESVSPAVAVFDCEIDQAKYCRRASRRYPKQCFSLTPQQVLNQAILP
jgi:hypothetical protein